MPIAQNTLFGLRDKEKMAIERIKTFEPLANGLFDTPYYVAYSGGKDSDVIRILCDLAGVPHTLEHNITTVEAPETNRYIKSIPDVNMNPPNINMWDLIVKKGIPPTRLIRYCCEELKEGGGEDSFVMTGVRWAESPRRRNQRHSLEIHTPTMKNSIMLNADNDKDRMMLETCVTKGKRILNPIVDWTNEEVWSFLNYYGVESNPLYQEGFTRIGCVGCPMAGKKRFFEFARWPKFQEKYIKTFQKMVDTHGYADTPDKWKSGEEVFAWWMEENPTIHQVEGQLELF